MSEFKEYKPMEIEHNVKAAVENLRKAYWSNETGKVAKHYAEAEDIIISAICHHHYTVCKETTEGDLINREALKEHKVYSEERHEYVVPVYNIDNAQAVDIKDQIAGAYNEGYMCGNKEAEKARPQGEHVDISKLRLMTVEECAGHTIEYAMGWKACIEWIMKGGAK